MASLQQPSTNWPVVDVEWWGRNLAGEAITGTATFEWLGGNAADTGANPPTSVLRKGEEVKIEKRTLAFDGTPFEYGYFKVQLAASNVDGIYGSGAPWRCTIRPTNADAPIPWEFWADPTASPIRLPLIQPVKLSSTLLPLPIPTWGDILQLRSQVQSLADQLITGGGGSQPWAGRIRFLKDDGTWPTDIPVPTEEAPVILFDNPAALVGQASIPDPPAGVINQWLRQIGGRPWASEVGA